MGFWLTLALGAVLGVMLFNLFLAVVFYSGRPRSLEVRRPEAGAIGKTQRGE